MSPKRWACRASAPIAGSPASTPRATPACTIVVAAALDADAHQPPRSKRRSSPPGLEHRRGQDWLGPELGVPARTVSRILRRHDVPRLCELRPADRRGDPRLEDHRGPLRTRPARRAGPHGRQEDRADPRRRRLASPRPPDGLHRSARRRPRSASTTSTPSSMTTAGSRTPRSSPTNRPPPAPAFFDPRRRLLRRPRHRPHRTGHDRQPLELHAQPTPSPHVLADLGARHKFIRPHCPWQNGKVERFNRTLANRMGLPAGLHHQRRTHRSPCTMARRLQHSTTPQRPRRPPTHQPTVTNLMAEYS